MPPSSPHDPTRQQVGHRVGPPSSAEGQGETGDGHDRQGGVGFCQGPTPTGTSPDGLAPWRLAVRSLRGTFCAAGMPLRSPRLSPPRVHLCGVDETLGPHVRPVLVDVCQAFIATGFRVGNRSSRRHSNECGPESILAFLIDQGIKVAVFAFKQVAHGKWCSLVVSSCVWVWYWQAMADGGQRALCRMAGSPSVRSPRG